MNNISASFIIITTLWINLSFAISKSNTQSQNSIGSLDTLTGKSNITDVTIFLQGAQITRTTKVDVRAKKVCIALKNLSPYLDPNSIKIKATDKTTILSVNHRLNFLNEKKKFSLLSKKEVLNDSIILQETNLNLLNEKQTFLKANKDIKGNNNGIQLVELSKIYGFYAENLKVVELEKLKINKKLVLLREEITQIDKQIRELRQSSKNTSGEIYVQVNTDGGTVGLEFSYLCENAGWFPTYDVRVKDVLTPVRLSYKANIYQNTGEDWEKIKLTFSNANPQEQGTAPQLYPYYLGYNYRPKNYNTYSTSTVYNETVKQVSGRVMDEEGQPIPGVNVLVAGTTVGTVTDMDGKYAIMIPHGSTQLMFSFIGFMSQTLPIYQNKMDVSLESDITTLEELVVTGTRSSFAKSLAGKVAGVNIKREKKKENIAMVLNHQTTVEFKTKINYTILSNGENYKIELVENDIPAQYEYFCIPKLDPSAYLVAKITNWDDYSLLEGEANLYFENTYVGKSILGTQNLTDTLQLSLGKDKGIVVKREKNKDFSKRRFIGTNRVETRSFKIGLRNTKPQNITLVLKDQVPVSQNNDITIEGIELSKGLLDTETGIVTWKLDLQPNVQEEKTIKYEVKYPRNKNLVVE